MEMVIFEILNFFSFWCGGSHEIGLLVCSEIGEHLFAIPNFAVFTNVSIEKQDQPEF